ncbi:GMC family oxidoreductase [Gulosibacter molinativorax]|uniref:FAD-binding protein n=1 Tax=Gulosibacter molinativorax TaxID=256821 RepID=A0ABT7C927_9MICO|nr:GMC family oxidoreductase N-terminal domain-containing protein [Gulosibacter molinativorax]MDJ1371232.1 FAD-binding protein [Gulosibacter molinativorax]QUY63048.1 Glucose-methanol-choline oxidoreductase [Gulosibacter molinativorax]
MTVYGADYVIVGSGAAGSVLAYRLSENPHVRVVVLESGGNDRAPVHRIPKGFFFTMHNDKYSKYFPTKPFGPHNTTEQWWRGHIVGGSTTTNGLVWNRGWKQDYDSLEAAGNPGWNWQGFLKAFREIEDFEPGANELHGGSGRERVQVAKPRDETTDLFIDSTSVVGAHRVDDINGSDDPRAGYGQYATRRGIRVSAADAYLHPALKRPNVRMLTHATVNNVTFSGKRATGVAFEHRGERHEVRAKLEVIVAGGTLDSPLLLERSGIGRGDVLAAAGVQQLVESPNVGERLQEHRGATLMYQIKDLPSFNTQLSSPPRYLATGAKYLATRTGVISQGSASGMVFFKVDPASDRPDAIGYFNPISTKTSQLAGSGLAVADEPGVMLGLYPLRPTSRGSIHITGPNAEDGGIVNPQFLTSDYDRKIVSQLVLKGREIFERGAISNYIVHETAPGTEVTDEESALRNSLEAGTNGYHPLSTCAMGPNDDDVVDADLRVRGVDALRVVDASVFVDQPSGNTSAPVQALAWQAAERIAAAH